MSEDLSTRGAGANGPAWDGLPFMEHLTFVVHRKALFLKVFVTSFFLAYAMIFLFIDEQFEGTALIIPRQEDVTASAGNLLRGIKSLPLGLGPKSAEPDIDLYTTVIYSRTMMENVIRKFDLLRLYRLDSASIDDMEKAVKRLRKEVDTKETVESAFQVTVRAGSRDLAAAMANYIVQRMNERINELKFSRSRENRIFLEQRVAEVGVQLKTAEDSLQSFQERTGLLDAKVQVSGILTADATLETELTAEKFKKSVLARMYDPESPEVKESEMRIQEYEKNLNLLRSRGEPGSPLLPLKGLPAASVEYLRRYRQVELNNLLLEYVLPLFEQAKIEEKRDLPVVQVIDEAIPPARKSYPPRTIFALIGACSATLLTFLVLFYRDAARRTANPRWRSLIDEATHWRRKTKRPVE